MIFDNYFNFCLAHLLSGKMETNLGKGSLGAAGQKRKRMEEGKGELGWLHEISCAVQSHAKEEEMIKITAYINIKSQIKEDVASIKKLSIAIKNRMSDIADAKKDIQEKEEEAVEKEKTLTDFGKEIKILEEKERETNMAIEVAREQQTNIANFSRRIDGFLIQWTSTRRTNISLKLKCNL